MNFDYNNTQDRKLYNVMSHVGSGLSHILYSVKVVGEENIPKDEPFILVSNHIHFVDPVLLMVKARRSVHFMGKKEAFQNKFAAWFLTNTNTFPVARGQGDKAAIEYAVKLIRDGRVIGIFPEGTRSKDLKPHAAKGGVALIARETKANVLPASIYCEQAKGLRRRITIRFGKLIPFEELDIPEEASARELREAAERIMQHVVALWEEGHCE